jgi:glycosyltransferase involved in cell wall biosynthesis
MDLPLVSVIMPAYNAAPYIRDAVNSILEQQLKNLELIVIDDASTDETANLLASFTDPRMVIHRNEENKGIVFSRNRGIALAKGKYIAILDSDDVALPDRLEKQVAFLEARPDHGACGSFYRVIDTNGKLLTSVTLPIEPEDTYTFLFFNVCFCHSTLMLRADVARLYEYREGFDIIEDYEIAYRISRQWKLGNVPSFTTLYRVHGQNISIDKKQHMLEVRKLMDRIVLSDLGIKYTENQLDLHSNFINLNHSFFSDKKRLIALEKWLLMYYQKLMHIPGINRKMVKRIMVVRWGLICARTGHIGMLLNNRLFFRFGGAYMRYNLGYLGNLITRRLEVV